MSHPRLSPGCFSVLPGWFGFPLQLCCSWDEHPLPGTATTPFLAGAASRRSDSVSQPSPTRLSPPRRGGPSSRPGELTPGESPLRKHPGKGRNARSPGGSHQQSQRWLRGTCYKGLPGAGRKPRGALLRGLHIVSWGGGHLRSRSTREEEAGIPGESTSVREQSGVQGSNTSQMRLGKVL